jgi:hypothetical protein
MAVARGRHAQARRPGEDRCGLHVSEGNTTRISAQEAWRRIERGDSLTDWARVRAMSDSDVEAAAADDPDWQDIDPDWVDKAKPLHPVRKRRLTPPSTRT